MRNCKVCVNIYYGLEFKGALKHLIQLSCIAKQNEARDVNDSPRVTEFINDELKLPLGFFCYTKSCKGGCNRHFHT